MCLCVCESLCMSCSCQGSAAWILESRFCREGAAWLSSTRLPLTEQPFLFIEGLTCVASCLSRPLASVNNSGRAHFELESAFGCVILK